MRQQSAGTAQPDATTPPKPGEGTHNAIKVAADFAATVLEGREPDDVLNLIALRAKELTGASRVSIASLEPDGRTICVHEVGSEAPASQLALDGSLYSQVLRTSSAVQVTDPEPRLLFPLLGGQRGQILELAKADAAGPFSWEETRTVELFTNAAAGSYVRARDRAAADRRLAAVMEITQAILQGIDQQEVLQLIARRARELVGAAVAGIYTPDPDGQTMRCRAADGVHAEELLNSPTPIANSMTGRSYTTGEAFNLPALADVSARYQPLGRLMNFGAAMFVPLGVGDRRVGAMNLGNMAAGREFTDDDLAVAQAFAAQAAVCLGYTAVREGLQRLGVPGAIERRSPEETFDVLARTIVEATHSDAAAIFQLDADGNLHTMGSFGLEVRLVELMDKAGRRGLPRAPLEAIRTRRVAMRQMQDVLDHMGTLGSEDWVRELDGMLRAASWDKVIAVPLLYQGRALGALAGYYARGYELGDTEVAFLRIVASQAATTLEIVRLFGLAQQKAALEERQRLARELHDSVSQALYGIALGAQTALDLLKKEPAAAAEPLRYVQRLAEAGLAEMRALIFELRPESLEREGLVAALRRQAALLRARYEIDVVENLGEEPDLTARAKESLFRIVQEAMQNIAKHSRATHVNIQLELTDSTVWLEIVDDGVGFDATREFPGHLGLQSMRERAAAIGAKLELTSSPGHGTWIAVTLAAGKTAEAEARKATPPAPVYRETFAHQISGFYAEMAARGYAVQTKLLRLERIVPPGIVAERLKLERGAPVVHVLRLRLVDGRPNHIAETFLRSDLFPGLESADLSQGSLYALLRERYSAKLARSEVVVEASPATLDQATQLEIELGAPVLAVKNTVHNLAGEPILFAQSWHRAQESQVEFEVLASDG